MAVELYDNAVSPGTTTTLGLPLAATDTIMQTRAPASVALQGIAAGATIKGVAGGTNSLVMSAPATATAAAQSINAQGIPSGVQILLDGIRIRL